MPSGHLETTTSGADWTVAPAGCFQRRRRRYSDQTAKVWESLMPEWMRTKLAEWYILIIGIVVIVAMAFLVYYGPQPSTVAVQKTASAAPKTPARADVQHTQAAAAASTSTLRTSASSQAPAPAPHDHTATLLQQIVAGTSQGLASRQTTTTVAATNVAQNTEPRRMVFRQ